MSSTVDVLVERLRDRRSGKVAFVSHCLLNENTRYLGGACRACCVREVVDGLLDRDIGIVQMPCPEQLAWGGVLKRHMLRMYGHPRAAALAGIARWYSRFVFGHIARTVAAQIADYVDAGSTVAGIIGVDGSPSCGVATTVDIAAAIRDIADTDPREVTIDQQNLLVRRHLEPGAGLFIEQLQRELTRRRLDVPFLAHDLMAELDGRSSDLIGQTGAARDSADISNLVERRSG